MKKVFLSYRRSDTEHLAGRLADHLNAASEINEVFFDIEDIELGENYLDRIATALAESDICLALIGKDWRGENSNDQTTRIFEDQDTVRLEVSMALKSPTRVLPVMANGAMMPKRAELPPDLAELPKINGATIMHTSFDRDVDAIIDAIMGRKRYRSLWNAVLYNPLFTKIFRSLIGVLLTFLCLIIVLAISQQVFGVSFADLNNKGISWLLIICTVTLGAIVPHFFKRKVKRNEKT